MTKHRGRQQQVFTACTLKELCPEDKQKVAKLVKQVVELGQENRRLKDAAEKASSAADEKVKHIQECNKQAVKENCSLKTKLGQAVTVLRMYHHKVQGLDAALRAMQHAATNSPDVSLDHTQHQQEQEPDDKQQQREQLALPQAHDDAAAADSPRITKQSAQGRLQLLSPASVTSSPAKDSVELIVPASAAAARLQQQAQRLSELLVKQDPATSSAHKPQVGTPNQSPLGLEEHSSKPESGGSSGSNTSLRLPCGHAGASAPHSQSAERNVGQPRPVGSAAPCSSPEALPGMPLVLPFHGAGVHEALHDLAAWQLRQGLITPGQAANTLQHKVLQFDPSIGSHGAFVIQEPPTVPPVGSSLGGPLATTASQSDTQHAQQKVEQQQQAPGAWSVRLQDQVPAGTVAGSSNRCSSAVPPGVLDASPWESPTCKQLMDLAAAFDSLATASTTPGGAARSTLGSSPAAVGLAAGVQGDALVHPDVATVAAGGLVPAGIASSAGGAASASIGVGLPCEYGVEEVPVESLGAGQLPVVVQNEKSWNSVCAPSPQTSAAGVETGSLPSMPSSTFFPQQMQRQTVWNQAPQPVQQQHSGSSMTQAQQYAEVADNWQQQPAQQQCMQGQRIEMQQHNYDYWQQQQPSEQGFGMQQQYQQVHPLQQPAMHMLHQAPAVGITLSDLAPPSRSPGHTDWQHAALQQQHLHVHDAGGLTQQSMLPSQALVQQQHQHSWVDQQPSQRQLHGCLRDGDSYVQQPRMLERYQQQVSDVGSSGLTLAPTDAQQLLKRFDDSLVDLLMEVERLEQQQQHLRRRRHQENQQQPLPSQQHIGVMQQQPGCGKRQPQQLQAWMVQQLPHRQHAFQEQQSQHDQDCQLIGRHQQLSAEQRHRVQSSGWPHSGVSYIVEAQDDEISEILNC